MMGSKCPPKKGQSLSFRFSRKSISRLKGEADVIDAEYVKPAGTSNIAHKTLPLHSDVRLAENVFRENKSVSENDEFYSPYTKFDAFWTVFAICCYLFDLGSDIFVAVMHYRYRNYWWFGLTVCFIVYPSLVISAFSITWYLQDRKDCEPSEEPKEGQFRWVVRYILSCLQLGPVMRYLETLIYGIKWMKARLAEDEASRQSLLEQRLWEEADSALLRLLKCFLEAAPQLTLQVYIIALQGIKGHVVLVIGQSISCVTSLISLSWSLVVYQKTLRLALSDKAKISYSAMVPMFLWQVFTIGPRVVCFALFAAAFSYWIYVVVGCHWIVMFVWILVQNTDFCKNSVREFFFDAVAAIISIFCFFNLLEGHTRLRYATYYVLVYLENLAMIVTWHSARSTEDVWYRPAALTVVLGVFFLGIFFQLLYYLSCHPNNDSKFKNTRGIRICVPCGKLVEEATANMHASKFNVTTDSKDAITLSITDT